MCEYCRVADFTKESIEMLLDKRFILEHLKHPDVNLYTKMAAMNLTEDQMTHDARVSIMFHATAEMALRGGLGFAYTLRIFELAMRRAAVRKYCEDNGLPHFGVSADDFTI